jgi:hypothetical protein
MNERIKELAEQAGIKEELVVTFKGDKRAYVVHHDDVEMLVKLIIQECAELNFRELGLSGSASFDVSRMIKQHFGVKE